MIELEKVDRSFGRVHAVRAVSFSVPAGAIVGVLGPNGAGKTTTIRLITGLLPPTRGRVVLNGAEVAPERRDLRRRIGYLPEANPLPAEMSVEGYLKYRARLFGMHGRSARDTINRTLDRCKVTDMRKRRIEHLSKGYRQRVGLAAALLHNPPLLILDEPTSGLDPAQVLETRALIAELAGQHTTLLVSHILPEVERTCDRLLIFAGGKLRADGTREALLAQSGANRYIVEYKSRANANNDLLAAVPGVNRCTTQSLNDQWTRAAVEFDTDVTDAGARLGAAAATHALTLRELRHDRPTLESLYISLVERAEEPV
ncbi:MAG: ABC transporter ATP-binding protein [Phycisphaerales bacterium]|nr:ABC transporter ATP-binding protein [Phycisphaerales bacterium]